jgi:hypothetical protein
MKFQINGVNQMYEHVKFLVGAEKIPFSEVDRERVVAVCSTWSSCEPVKLSEVLGFGEFFAEGEESNISDGHKSTHCFDLNPLIARRDILLPLNPHVSKDLVNRAELVSDTRLLVRGYSLKVKRYEAPKENWLRRRFGKPTRVSRILNIGQISLEHGMGDVRTLYGGDEVIPVYQDNPNFEAIMNELEERK